jgi:hypothetical protein
MSIARQWVWLPQYYRYIRHNTDTKHSSGTLGVGVFYHGRPAVITGSELEE